MALRYTAATTVRHVEVEGLRVILDLSTESYRILDDAASALWSVLIGERSSHAVFAALAAEYDISEARWLADLDEFASRCLGEGLLMPADTPSGIAATPPSAPRIGGSRPALLEAFVCLLATRRLLRRRGFCATYESYARIVAKPTLARLEPALSAFRRAENLVVAGQAPGDCLLRSLSLYRFLSSLGCQASHVIGVRRFAFSAHAWVESGGRPLLDDRAREFTPIARIGPPMQPAA